MPLPFGEIYDKLKSGELDGQEHPIAPIYAGKFYEVQKYLSLTKHMYGPLIQCRLARVLSMTADFLSKILDDVWIFWTKNLQR